MLVAAELDMLGTVSSAQISMNVVVLGRARVIPTPFAITLKDLMFVNVLMDMKEMDEIAKIQMNVPEMKQIAATRTPSVPTLKAHTSAAASEAMLEMGRIVQLSSLVVLHLAVLTHFVRKTKDGLRVAAILVILETGTTVQTLTNVMSGMVPM